RHPDRRHEQRPLAPAAQHPDAFDLTDADNVEFAMGVFSAGQTTHFRRANVQGYDHIVGLMD
ncbi:MAG TPA: hypothetical protein PKL15_17410, partial [Saprospiraceae bacterium]|nr:hypothetical protein [Saprospiraceae bacterium]